MFWSWVMLLLIACSFTAEGQSYGYSITGGKSSVTIPFELRNYLIILKVSVNGSKPLNFILDSGSRNTFLLKPELKDSLSLQPSGQIFVLGAGLKDTVVADVIRGVNLSTGLLNGKFQSVLVLNKELPEISEMLGVDIHGILGADLFNRFAIRVNYKKRRITFLHPDDLKPGMGFQELPVEVANNKGYINTLIYNEWNQPKTAKMMLDCGASLAMMFNFSEDEDDVYPLFSEYIPSEIGIGLAGVIPGYVGRLYSAQIGVYPLFNIIISAVPTTRADDYFLNERDGLIGGEVLSRFHIWYNFPLSKIYIKPARGWDKPFNYDRSGIIWMSKRDEDGNAVVRQVIIKSPAYEAGIQGGDVVTTINGKPVKNLSNADISQMLRSSSKKTFTIEVFRNDEALKFKLKLKDYF